MGTPLETDISERELDQMERRSRAATPGPWFSLVVGRDLEAGLNCIEVGYRAMEVLGGTVADQDFIANAREDMPRLIEEVRRLRAEMKLRAASARPVATAITTNSATAPLIPITC